MIPEEEIRLLKEKVKKLEEEKDSLAKEKDSIEQEFEKTKKEFEEFKSLHATTVDNLKHALKIKANSKIVSRPLGAPKGHKGYSRHVPERIDRIKELISNKCPYCKTSLGETQEVRSRYVTDIKLKLDVINTQYN